MKPLLFQVNLFRQWLRQHLFFQLCATALIISLPQHWLKAGDKAELPGKTNYILGQILSSSALQSDILQFTGALLFINLLLIGLTWTLARMCCHYLHFPKQHLGNIGVGLYLTITLYIFLENASQFPTSHYAYFFNDTYGETAIQLLRYILLIALSGLSILALTAALKPVRLPQVKKGAIAAASIALIIPLTAMIMPNDAPPVITAQNKPDVIIIGIDSVSSIHLEKYGEHMPFISSFIKESAYFDNTTSPLARTFPAWTSILTGLYPKHHGARFNLYDFDQISLENTLPKVLRDNGYTTVFAMDERRFSNIDKSYGFDYAIGPKISAADFILPELADSPLVNLAVGSPIGHQLFPQLALNVAAHRTYEPSRFNEHLLTLLARLDSNPKFIASHFCLAHFPFEWRDHYEYRKDLSRTTGTITRGHIAALKRIDKQVESYFLGLQKLGLLKNSIVILLTDHGEATGNDNDVLINKDNYVGSTIEETHTQIINVAQQSRFGHGVSTLSPTQFQSILAVRSFIPNKPVSVSKTSVQASLIDIMPTILSMLDITHPTKMDGVPLIKTIPNESNYSIADVKPRPTYMETGITFRSMLDLTNFDPAKLLAESLSFYEIVEESGRLHLIPEHYEKLIARKQRAVILGDWQLTLTSDKKGTLQPLLLNNKTQQWTYDFSSTLAKQAPAEELFTKFADFYSDEVNLKSMCSEALLSPSPFCALPLLQLWKLREQLVGTLSLQKLHRL